MKLYIKVNEQAELVFDPSLDVWSLRQRDVSGKETINRIETLSALAIMLHVGGKLP
jgi:hypothetical protein